MGNQQHGDTTQGQSGSVKNFSSDPQKAGEAGRKGAQQSHQGGGSQQQRTNQPKPGQQGAHAAGSGSSTGDPGNPRGEQRGSNAMNNDSQKKGGSSSQGH